MADGEYVRRSVKDLAAGLNVAEVGRVPITSKPAKPLIKPKLEQRSISASVPIVGTNGDNPGNLPSGDDGRDAPAPRLPPRQAANHMHIQASASTVKDRRPTVKPPPTPSVPDLPARRPSEQPTLPATRPSEASTILNTTLMVKASGPALPARRGSQVAVGSTIPVISATIKTSGLNDPQAPRTPSTCGPRVRAPAYDPSFLPPLPPKRPAKQTEDEGQCRPPALPDRTKPGVSIPGIEQNLSPTVPSLPQRPGSIARAQPTRGLPAQNLPIGPTLQRPVIKIDSADRTNGAPPPVPLSSRPDLSKLIATKPEYTRPTPASTVSSTCLHCRDFSGPDNHAARFPRHTVSSLSQLARDLTASFSTLTDKARAIFTWMHHNIAYDCDAFFGNRVYGVTPIDTLRSGLAVCAGYAGLYADLAMHAGLECVVVGGHGKGFGYVPLQPGQPVPPESQGHAWNAVKIDVPVGGDGVDGRPYWKLLDACWGSGVLGDDKKYKKIFSPREFCSSNEDFGRRHFPQERDKQFRGDRRVISWQEYIIGDGGGEGVQVYSSVAPHEGISESRFLPKPKRLDLNPAVHAATQGIIRFQFQRVCEHWRPEVNNPGGGKDFCYVLACGSSEWEPFESNGMYWWCDVHVSKLGKIGDTLNIWVIDTVNGETGRGLTAEDFRGKRGRAAMGFSGLACWILR